MNRISVCMATYNGEKFIEAQIKSILHQLKDEDEIIISDDSSTDRTLDIVRSFDDSRIKIFANQKFANPIFNFENALKLAKGQVIFLSDQDDLWHPEKVSKMLNVLHDADTVICDCSIIDETGTELVKSYFDLVKSSPGILHNLKKNTYFGCCMAFKREVLNKALPFPKQIPMHDIWLGFVSDVFFKSVFLNECLTYYRKHSNNASIASDVVSNLNIMTKLKFRINIIRYLPNLFFRR